nr:NAD(P)-dependent oxidoreductase [Gammaproteobacteria bacterium]
MNSPSNSIITKAGLIRQLADSLTIFLACFLSVSFIDQDKTIIQVTYQAISLFLLFLIVFLPSFFITGIYTYARFYSTRKKYLKILTSSFLSGIILIIIFLLARTYFILDIPLSNIIFSDISIAWFLTTIGCLSSRSWLHFYSKNTFSIDNIEDYYTSDQKVLVLGGAGYIGSSLIKKLLKAGFKVRVIDILMFGEEPIQEFLDNKNFELIKADFRKIDDLVIAMRGCSSLVHLGGIVGDPASSLDEDVTREVNLTSTKVIGQIAKSSGIKKFIFASSCSVYGAQDNILDEESSTKPLSLYAQTKIASEKVLSELSSIDFAPVFLRFGTVFGISGRTRFDLVVNLLTARAYIEKSMTVYGPNQVRPFLHVSDAAESVLKVLNAPIESVNNEVFNVGSTDQNYTLLELAEIIKTKIPDSEINIEADNMDSRNYNVSFAKISRQLNFQTTFSLEMGIDQVIDEFDKGKITDYKESKYSNVLHLSEEGL